MTTASTHTVVSDGGVAVTLPQAWRPARTVEDATVFVGERGTDDVVPTAVVETHDGHLQPADWWVEQAAVLPGAMLLEVATDGMGFRAQWTHLADGRSITGHVRARHLPGRTMLLVVVHATRDLDQVGPVAQQALDSLDVAGLP